MSKGEVSELLKPRYKVIADYPQPPYYEDDNTHKFIEGDILHYVKVNSSMTFRRVGRLGHLSVGVPCCSNPEKFPKIFKPLAWYEEREASEMPEYVKEGEFVSRAEWIPGVETENGMQPMRMKLLDDDEYADWQVIPNVMCFYEPATETEYNQYLKTKQK